MFSPSSSKQRVLLFTWMEITPAAAEAEVAQVRWCSLTWYQNSCEGPLIGNNTLVALKREATLTLRQKETFRGPLSPHRIRLGISNFLLELLINVAKCDFWSDFSNTISLSNGWSRSDFKSNEEVCEYWKLWADNQTVFNPLNWCDHGLEIRTPCLLLCKTDEEVSKGLKRTIYYSDQTRRKGVGIYREKIKFNFLVLKYILKLVKEKNFAICSLRKNPIGRVTQLFRKRESRKF